MSSTLKFVCTIVFAAIFVSAQQLQTAVDDGQQLQDADESGRGGGGGMGFGGSGRPTDLYTAWRYIQAMRDARQRLLGANPSDGMMMNSPMGYQGWRPWWMSSARHAPRRFGESEDETMADRLPMQRKRVFDDDDDNNSDDDNDDDDEMDQHRKRNDDDDDSDDDRRRGRDDSDDDDDEDDEDRNLGHRGGGGGGRGRHGHHGGGRKPHHHGGRPCHRHHHKRHRPHHRPHHNKPRFEDDDDNDNEGGGDNDDDRRRGPMMMMSPFGGGGDRRREMMMMMWRHRAWAMRHRFGGGGRSSADWPMMNGGMNGRRPEWSSPFSHWPQQQQRGGFGGDGNNDNDDGSATGPLQQQLRQPVIIVVTQPQPPQQQQPEEPEELPQEPQPPQMQPPPPMQQQQPSLADLDQTTTPAPPSSGFSHFQPLAQCNISCTPPSSRGGNRGVGGNSAAFVFGSPSLSAAERRACIKCEMDCHRQQKDAVNMTELVMCASQVVNDIVPSGSCTRAFTCLRTCGGQVTRVVNTQGNATTMTPDAMKQLWNNCVSNCCDDAGTCADTDGNNLMCGLQQQVRVQVMQRCDPMRAQCRQQCASTCEPQRGAALPTATTDDSQTTTPPTPLVTDQADLNA